MRIAKPSVGQTAVRGGFTRVDLLVLMTLAACSVSFMAPFGDDAQEKGRRLRCQNNLRLVATSLLIYENARNQFPGYQNVVVLNNGKPYADPTTGKKTGVSFIVRILRQLDRPDLDTAWKTPVAGNGEARPKTSDYLEFLVCPSDAPENKTGAPLSYAVNCGMEDWAGSDAMPRDWGENGVFFDRFTGDVRVNTADQKPIPQVSISSAFIARGDGMQNTLLVAENVDAGQWTDSAEAALGLVWNGTGKINAGQSPPHLVPPDANMQINHRPLLSGKIAQPGTTFARPSSNHIGGANTAFCDSHVTFLSEKIDYFVYCLLMSSNGFKVKLPGSNDVLPGYNVPINDDWIDLN